MWHEECPGNNKSVAFANVLSKLDLTPPSIVANGRLGITHAHTRGLQTTESGRGTRAWKMAYGPDASPEPGCSKDIAIFIDSPPSSVPVSPVKPVSGRESMAKSRKLLF